MADVSHRKDIYLLWNQVLRNTAATLPCELCRSHMNTYLATHPFVPKNWIHLPVTVIRENIRRWISDFHNSVNQRLGKPVVPLAQLDGDGMDCQGKLRTIHETLRTLLETWDSAKVPTHHWRSAVAHLIGFLKCGPDPA